MPGSYVVVTGVKEVRRLFRNLPGKVAKKILRKTLREALKPIAADARTRAPVRTGALREQIKVRARAKRKAGFIGLEIRVGSHNFAGKTFYAGFQEFGTGKRGTGKKGVTTSPGITARHFMQQAFDAHSEKAAEYIKDELIRAIESGGK